MMTIQVDNKTLLSEERESKISVTKRESRMMSPVAVASALSEGSSWICTSTKNLQTQYNNDFKWIAMAKSLFLEFCHCVRVCIIYFTNSFYIFGISEFISPD
jgi:hypothetical protein